MMLDGTIRMKRVIALLPLLACATGCQVVWVVPPADGRVVDAGSGQPIEDAVIVRTHEHASVNAKSDRNGFFKFHGKRTLAVPVGALVVTQVSYRIEASGYQAAETNWSLCLAHNHALRHHLGEVHLPQK
jgi:hypothetical protein